jgi:ERCC4-type nuclease
VLELDPRIGSVELAPIISQFGVQASTSRQLPFGDACWEGRGPGNKAVMIGVERKRIDDLLQSMQSKRLQGYQLPGMAEMYDYAYLVVEGFWRPSRDGATIEVMIGPRWVERAISPAAVNNFLMSLSFRTGLVVWRTGMDWETALFLVHQYRMWRKPWEEHQAHDAVYAPAESGRGGRRFTLVPRKHSLKEKVALQLPGLDGKAKHVADGFKSVREMANASAEDWAEVKWLTTKGESRRLGKAAADRIVKLIRAEE